MHCIVRYIVHDIAMCHAIYRAKYISRDISCDMSSDISCGMLRAIYHVIMGATLDAGIERRRKANVKRRPQLTKHNDSLDACVETTQIIFKSRITGDAR